MEYNFIGNNELKNNTLDLKTLKKMIFLLSTRGIKLRILS